MVAIWQAIEMAYSIAAATIAALKRFTESLNTGFGHGELIRVHGHSQNYKLSDRSASSGDSRISKPSVAKQVQPIQQEPLTLSIFAQEDYNLQQLNLKRKSPVHEARVSTPQKSSGSGKKALKSKHSTDKSIMHDVQYSIHYDEEPLVPPNASNL